MQPVHEECMTDTLVEEKSTTENMSQELIERDDDNRFQQSLSADPAENSDSE